MKKVKCIDTILLSELTPGKQYDVVRVDHNENGDELYHITNDLGQNHIYSAHRFETVYTPSKTEV